ncbi:thioredoxin reductase NTRB-like protein [Tanacetum coccineum]
MDNLQTLKTRLCIISSGPAAHTATIYAALAEIKPIFFEGWIANDIAAGGHLTTTTDVENFSGFPEVVIGSAVGYNMDEVDMVFVGADDVVESGCIINMMGTYQIALVAKSMDNPVAAESYKFARSHLLSIRSEGIV